MKIILEKEQIYARDKPVVIYSIINDSN